MTEYKVGDVVEVYRLMDPLRDLKCTAKILKIGELCGTPVVWLEGVSGAWAVDAIKHVDAKEDKV